MTHFRKQPDGSWRFNSPTTGDTYEAWRNPAGFAGRDWELRKIDWYAIARGRYGEMRKVIRDDYASRADCVAAVGNIEAFDESLRDFAAAIVLRPR